LEAKETRKRKREIFIAVTAAIVFVALTWVEFRLANISQQLPFVHSVFFFGLVNFNIILLLFLLFLIFRNVVKVFVETPGQLIGATIKGKLVVAFLAFSIIPTLLMFSISVFYINSSFDKWFSVKMAGVLKDSLEVTNSYYLQAKRRNYHFAHRVANDVRSKGNTSIRKLLEYSKKQYSLDAVEFYPDLLKNRMVSVSEEQNIGEVPNVSLEFLEKGISEKIEASTIHHFGEGNLVRVIVPVLSGGAIVVSSFVPLSLITKMDDVAAAYEELRNVNPLEYPLKSIYTIVLVLMTLVIVFAATWLGFHLARQLSTPLEKLAKAARQISRGKYSPVDLESGSLEINQLVESFNTMTVDLKETLATLDEHSRYMGVILRNVSAGVVSVNRNGQISTINRHASQLLKIEAEKFIGKEIREFLSGEHLSTFESVINTLKTHRIPNLQKEIQLTIDGGTSFFQVTASLLLDEQGKDLGFVFLFDDMTMMVNAQRAAAWREVARRIAHEIKNPLTPIKLSAQRLEKKFADDITDPAFKQCIATIIDQVDDLKNLVNEFNSFARLPQSKPTPGDLNKVLSQVGILYKTAHKDIEFRLKFDEKLPIFSFDADQMKRIVGNLLENSVAACSEECEIPYIEISTHYDPSLALVRIEVVDNGCGMTATVRERVFEPYFSTKKTGTGLGLAIVKRNVDDHNGFIRAFSNSPQGTKFVIEIPVRDLRSSVFVQGRTEGDPNA